MPGSVRAFFQQKRAMFSAQALGYLCRTGSRGQAFEGRSNRQMRLGVLAPALSRCVVQAWRRLLDACQSIFPVGAQSWGQGGW